MDINDETLMAYADGELDATTRAQVEAALAGDATLARRVAAHQALTRQLRSSFAGVLEEPVPRHLLDAARSNPSEPSAQGSSAKVVELRPRRASRWREWGALAAGLLLGALSLQLARQAHAPLITTHDGIALASGSLARALDSQLAANQPAASPVRMGISFKTHDGRYCRTFTLPATAGLACRGDEGWRLNVLSSAASASGTYRQAASSLPPAVLQEVEGSISGEPLDATAEARAQASGWRDGAH